MISLGQTSRQMRPVIHLFCWRIASYNCTMRSELARYCRAFTRVISLGIGALTFVNGVARGDVIVVANRTPAPIAFRFVPVSGDALQLNLPAGETLPLFLDGKANLFFSTTDGGQKQYTLDANCAYYFGRGQNGRLDLQRHGLGQDG